VRISVCIATFNGQEYIEEQLLSILNQLEDKDEIIISDDGSTDSTIEICNKFKDSRIKIFFNEDKLKHSPNINKATKNFENAINKSSGELIFLCDQDDIWYENKVQIIKQIYSTSNFLCLVHDATIINSSGDIIESSYFNKINSGPGIFKNLISNSFLGCSMVFSKKVKNRILPFPKELHAHDMWIGLISEYYSKVFFLKEPLIYYRRHSKNVTNSGYKSSNPLNYKINYRLKFLFQFIARILKF
jgi:glycosyltransferase involved in cell wall biosynthesis